MKFIDVMLYSLLVFALGMFLYENVYAQGSIGAQSGSFSISSAPNTTVANCPPVTASSSKLCVVSTGVYISNAGGAYVLLGATGSAGVTSWNGQVGAVSYNPPVSSVNGKTGSVVLAIN